MLRHLHFLGVLYLVWGGLSILLGAATLFLAAGAALIVTTIPPEASASHSAVITAGTFAAVGLAALVWGAAHVLTGRGLRRRRPASREPALALGAVNLLLLPFGTALGVYALWVLSHEESRQLLESVRG